nr:radical SAM protein [Methanocella sp. CWC-04]
MSAEQTITNAVKKDPDAIGVRISLPSLIPDIKLINGIKERCPSAKVFGFGPVIKNTYDHWIDEFKGDFLLFGEPEAVISDVLASGDIRSCEGVLYRDDEGLKITSDWVYCQDIESLPYPAWHLIPLKYYAFRHKVEDFTFYVLSSRGCPNKCNMCPYPVHHGRKWRSRGPESVLGELIYLKERFGATNIQFRDPNFALNKNRLVGLCNSIVGSGRRWRWTCEVDLQNLNEELINIMAKAGCARIMTGIESTDDSTLSEIGQDPGSVPKIERMIDVCRSHNIDLTGFYIVGFPGETWDSVSRNLDYARKINIRSVVSLMTPYHGTGLREDALKEKLIKEDAGFGSYDGFNCVIRSRQMDFGDIELAWKYMSSELDYVNSELMFRKYSDARKLGALVKMAENRIRYMPVRSQAKKKLTSYKN